MLFLLLASTTADVSATQVRLDELVHRCDAQKVVRLVAKSRTEVVIDMMIVRRAPSQRENQRFSCVLGGMQRMPDLQFGFIGNEALGGNRD